MTEISITLININHKSLERIQIVTDKAKHSITCRLMTKAYQIPQKTVNEHQKERCIDTSLELDSTEIS